MRTVDDKNNNKKIKENLKSKKIMTEDKKNKEKQISKKTITKNQNIEKEKTKKNKIKEKNTFTTIEVVSLIIISVIVSLVMGGLISSNLNKGKTVNNDKDLQEFIKNYNYIIDNYYDEVDKKELLNNALKGMLDSLEDDYSYLLDESDSSNFNIQLEGQYQGIGIEIVSLTNGDIIIYNVFEDSPADKAGLKVEDIILKINDEDFSKKTPSDISSYIRDSKDKEFVLEIKRNNEIKKITVQKQSVTIKAVKSKIYNKDNKKIGYIYIDIFSNVAYKQFKEELQKLEKEKIDSLIIDVRDNTGGHLTTATNIISLFLDSSHVIYQTETKTNIKKYYSVGTVTKKYPIIILQNENSASASEMLSAALKEEYGATIIGKISYGKGTVQEMLELSNGSEYKITTKKWLTPKGNWINKKGVDVDIDVSLDDKYKDNPTDENDNQLQKAIEEAAKK